MVKWVTSTTLAATMSIRSFLAIVIVIASLVRAINGFLPIQMNGASGRAYSSGTDARKLFGGYRITPKHCRATKTLPISDPRINGPTICMFNHECAQRNGEVVGACMDGFLFGACCQIPNVQQIESTLINDAQNAYFQQYQQQKLQMQQAMTNPVAAQSYENYGESMQQQSTEVSNQENYQMHKQQQLQTQQQQQQGSHYQSSSQAITSSTTGNSNYHSETQAGSSTSSSILSTTYQHPQENPTTASIASTSQEISTSNHSEQEADNTESVPQVLTKTASVKPVFSSTLPPISQPPRVHVHKDSVKISSPSSPPHNDDFVMQVLSTLPPDHDNDHITFTTEVPMKIASSSADRFSSESNSFEEEPQVTQVPVQLIEKPISNNEPIKAQQQSSTHKTQHPQHQQQQQQQQQLVEHQHRPELQHKKNQQPTHQQGHYQNQNKQHQQQQGQVQKHQNDQIQQQHQQQNMHHHNHLLLDTNEFTHSDITHPGAEADIVEDLQFSTGYGPQPVVVEPPKIGAPVSNYENDGNIKGPQPDDKYVLVQTISNDQSYKPQLPSSNPTTTSSITTHVDSIESIILQLNNTNHGPVYSVIDQDEQPYSPSTTLSSYQSTSDGSSATDKQDNYYGSGTNPASASVKPLQSVPTESSVGYYEEIETKRPENYQQQSNPGHSSQVPAYLEPVTTNLNYVPDNEYAADIMSESSHMGPSSYKPEESSPTSIYSDESVAALNDVTLPNKNYNDVSDVGHQTSEFNKMPVVGIAYPVDMSHMNEDGNLLSEEESSYQKLSTQTTSQRPQPSSTSTDIYNAESEQSSSQTETAYTRLPTVVDSKPHKRPISTYIGVVTAPSYNQQQKQPPLNYNQVPEEVSVTSHTTKVQEEYGGSTSYQTLQTQKLTTISYVDTPVTTSKPLYTKPSTHFYTSTQSTTVSRPPYDSLVLSPSTNRPKPSKRPGLSNTKKTSKPYGTKQPTTTYTQIQQNNYQQDNYQSSANKEPSVNLFNTPIGNYNQEPTEPYLTNNFPSTTQKQPSNKYDAILSKPETVEPVRQPSNPYAQDSEEKITEITYNVPKQPSVSYNQEQHISSPPAKASATRKPSTNKKPISTSYVTGPTTARPPTTSAYENEVPPLIITNGKLDSFVQSTADNIAGSSSPIADNYQAPVHVAAVTPLQIQGTYNGHKKPGFVKIKATTRPPLPTVVITPKPTTNSYVKQPISNSYDTGYHPPTTPIPAFASTSYIYSPMITRRPDYIESTSEYVSLPPINSNDFYDPGYYGNQAVTQSTYAVPSDDRPAFPGYFGPTPTYPAFQIPGEKNEGSVEETYTSPNDFVNFPPVRNPNLNMSAASSAVTSDLELSTPAFVEDGVLKDKMNTLVHKIVESLQGNFEALAEIIDETAEPSTYQAAGTPSTTTYATRKPTRKPVTTKTKPTTKKPVTRLTTKPATKKPTVTTRKPVTRRTTTRRPVTTRRPTKKPTPTTTNAAPFQDEIIDEEDGEDINLTENEISDSGTSGAGAGGRKIQCGVRPHVKSGRIVGGKGSAFGAYPWQVLVRESTWLGLFTKNKCGGVLITNKYVITAAHCQPGFLASLVAVMGEFDISGDLESKKAVTKNVKRVIVHRQYDPATFENDLALLELESPVQFDTHIVPICMPQDTADFTGRMATVTGWGRLKYGGGVPSVLQEVQVPIIENSVCQEMFHTAGHNKKILNSFLCAGYANGQKDSCEGDSGGPLVLQRPDGRYELAGTVSHGIKCAAPYLPGVYMRTTYYKPWLRSITGVK